MRTRAPCTSTPGEPRVGPREVEELEDAERAVARPARAPASSARRRSSASTSSPGRSRARTSAPTRSSAHVSDATTGSSPSRPSTSGRKPCASRKREERAVGEPDDASRRLRAAPSSPRPPPRAARSSSAISAAITSESERRRERLADLVAQLRGVDEVAVVPERDRAHAAVVEQRLRVRPGVAAGRRVARVADRELAVQAGEAALVEDLRDEPEVAQRRQPAVLADGDPGRLLAAVLQRVEAEVARAARRRVRARGRRRRRTSGAPARARRRRPTGSRPARRDDHALGLRRRRQSASRARPRRGLAQRERDAAVRDVVREREQVRVPPDEARRARDRSRAGAQTRSPLCHRSGIARHVADEADAADDRRRRDRRAAGLVVERHVSRDDGDPERFAQRARCPRSPARAPSRSPASPGCRSSGSR